MGGNGAGRAVNRWSRAVREAQAIQRAFPGWRARAVRLHWGTGVEAVRDSGRLRAVIGTAAEVRTVLGAEEAA